MAGGQQVEVHHGAGQEQLAFGKGVTPFAKEPETQSTGLPPLWEVRPFTIEHAGVRL